MKKFVFGISLLALFGTVIPFAVANAQAVLLLDHVVISPGTATVLVNGTQQFAAIGQDTTNATVTNVTYSWAVVVGGGTIDGNGLFSSGNTTGNSTVQVTAAQNVTIKTANSSVTIVVPGPLDHVIVSPDNVTIVKGGTQQFTAVGQDAANVTIPSLVYIWEVVAGGGTINGTGFFTAGNVTGNFTDTVKVSVVQGSVTKTAYATVKVKAANAGGGEEGRDEPEGWSHGKKNGWGDGHTPPGWSHGKKNGWGDGKTPPGLAKDREADESESD